MIDCHQGKMDWSIAPKQLVALTGPLAEMQQEQQMDPSEMLVTELTVGQMVRSQQFVVELVAERDHWTGDQLQKIHQTLLEGETFVVAVGLQTQLVEEMAD